MPLDFEKHAQIGTAFLSALAEELGDQANRQLAGRMVRAVFRALRNHLTLEENFQLISQLPMTLKAVYIDGWIPSKKRPTSRKKSHFIAEVKHEDDAMRSEDFANKAEVTFAVGAVLRTLQRYISFGELEDILGVLPKSLRNYLLKAMDTRMPPQRIVDSVPL
jgi:uncharacterized protein (DUF2267 family)